MYMSNWGKYTLILTRRDRREFVTKIEENPI